MKPLVLVLILASLLRFIGLWPNIAHPDEAHVQIYSWNLINNILTNGDFDPHTFKYGSFFFYSQALVSFPILFFNYLLSNINVWISSSFASSFLNFSLFFEEATRKYSDALTFAGRAQVALFGFLSVYLLFLIGRKLFNKEVGFLAALFLAISPLHVRDSHYITTDIPLIFFLLLSFYFLILLWQEKKLKWFIFSGLFLGLGSTVRFFPLGLLALPLALIFGFEKSKNWILKVLILFLFVAVGIFAGLPFLFLNPDGPAYFMKDMEKYVFPWYSTSITQFIFSLGKSDLPPFSSLLPQYFRPFYLAQFFFFGLGPILFLVSILGIVATFLISKKKLMILLIIPLVNFIYISSYIPSSYERLVIPVIPFMALFGAVFINSIKEKFKFVLVLLLVFQPLIISLKSVASCSRDTVQKQSSQWIDQNIKDQAKIGYLTLISFPSTRNFDAYYGLEPDREISLEEARNLDLDHAFLNGNRLDYVTYPYFVNTFFPDEVSFENSYYSLVLKEYLSRATLLKKLDKPFMCDSHRIYYFKLSEKLPFQQNILQNDFNWQLDSFTLLTPPRIYSKQIPVKEGHIFTFSAHVKSSEPTRAILRMDFYSPSKKDNLDLIQKAWLLFWEGSTPVYFEKKLGKSFYENSRFPGQVVALSPRIKIDDEQEISLTAQTPTGAEFMVLSVQSVDSPKNVLKILDAKLLGH